MQISKSELDAVIASSDVPVILEFHSNSCIPCLTQEDLLDAAAAQPGFPAQLVNINVDEDALHARQYKVTSVPTVVLVDHGEVVARFDSLIDPGSVVSAISNP